MESDDKRDGSGYDYRDSDEPLAESTGEVPDWGEIVFPRKIGCTEARRLVRHLAFHVDDCYVELNTSRHEHFGNRFMELVPTCPREVPLEIEGIGLSGIVQRTSERQARIEFTFNQVYDRKRRVGYEGMNLTFGIYDWKDLDDSNKQLVGDIKSAVRGYFDSEKN